MSVSLILVGNKIFGSKLTYTRSDCLSKRRHPSLRKLQSAVYISRSSCTWMTQCLIMRWFMRNTRESWYAWATCACILKADVTCLSLCLQRWSAMYVLLCIVAICVIAHAYTVRLKRSDIACKNCSEYVMWNKGPGSRIYGFYIKAD